MNLKVIAGCANPSLAASLSAALGVPVMPRELSRFRDGELHVELHESVRGSDVYLSQSLDPPIHEHLMELLILADACRRAGAARLTAIMPYLGYARQDRRVRGREPVGARLVADLLAAAGLQRVVAVDLHTPALEGFFTIPLEHLSAVPQLAEAARPWATPESVVVAPDLGAAKLADHYARLLGLPVALVHKTRLSGEEVTAHRLTGDVRNRRPIVVDDMISTGGTIEAATSLLLESGALPELTVVASHALLVGPAVERLERLPLRRLIVTDSVRWTPQAPLPIEVVGLGSLLATAVARLHGDQSLADLRSSG